MSGRHLKRIRIANGYSQAQVARELHIDRAKVSRWENGIAEPEDDDIKALAELYAVEETVIREYLFEKDSDTEIKGAESLIAEKIDELHISVSNEISAAIANQEQSIRQQAEQIETQRETLKLYANKLDENSRLQDAYLSELEKSRSEYRKNISRVMIGSVMAVLILAFLVLTILLVLNYKSSDKDHDVSVPAIEIDEEVLS